MPSSKAALHRRQLFWFKPTNCRVQHGLCKTLDDNLSWHKIMDRNGLWMPDAPQTSSTPGWMGPQSATSQCANLKTQIGLNCYSFLIPSWPLRNDVHHTINARSGIFCSAFLQPRDVTSHSSGSKKLVAYGDLPKNIRGLAKDLSTDSWWWDEGPRAGPKPTVGPSPRSWATPGTPYDARELTMGYHGVPRVNVS